MAFKQVGSSTPGEVKLIFALAETGLPSGITTLGSFLARAHTVAAETTSALGLTLAEVYDQSGLPIVKGNMAINGLVLIHNQQPSVESAGFSADGKVFNLKLSGQIGEKYRIDVSENLEIWLPLRTIDNQDGTVSVDIDVENDVTARFYRAVLVN